jgi:hypothetical protein
MTVARGHGMAKRPLDESARHLQVAVIRIATGGHVRHIGVCAGQGSLVTWCCPALGGRRSVLGF